MRNFKIGRRWVGDDHPAYLIAEFGVNHNNSLERALEGVQKAAQAGADAIKFQTYTADELVCKGTPKFWHWEGDQDKKDQYEAYKAIGNFPKQYYSKVISECEKYGIEFLSTPFSFEAANFLNDLGMKAFKVASSDITSIPYLRHIAKFGKPILLSTGAATVGEIQDAVDAIRGEGNNQIVIMQCTLCYPTNDEDANLNVIQTLKNIFPNNVVGLSDHTLGTLGSIVASVLGAKVIEKHFTVDKTLPDSADHWLSVDPTELSHIKYGIQHVEMLKGQSEKYVLPCEFETRLHDKRSIVSKVAIPKGTVITEDMITYKRPGTGIPPKFNNVVVGRTAQQDIPEDVPLKWPML